MFDRHSVTDVVLRALRGRLDGGVPKGQRWYSKGQYLAGLPDDAVDVLVERAAGLAGPFTMAYVAMSDFASGGVYVNLLSPDEGERVRSAYGANYERLAEVKRTWDPDNLFRVNHNVAP